MRLGVNIDHAATLREARYRDFRGKAGGIIEPDPVWVALEAQKAGADCITVHPREDGRHIQREDVIRLKEVLQIGINLEMAVTGNMLEFAHAIVPESVCFVPEKREEVTTEGGLNVAANVHLIGEAVERCQKLGTRVSLFIDADCEQVKASAASGAEMVELHTGAYANAAGNPGETEEEWKRLESSAELANQLGLQVNIGHGINYTNIMRLRDLPHIVEMNIGHSLLARSLLTGIGEAVREMKARMLGQVR